MGSHRGRWLIRLTRRGGGHQGGGMPVTYPLDVFESAWTLHFLLRGGFHLSLGDPRIARIVAWLRRASGPEGVGWRVAARSRKMGMIRRRRLRRSMIWGRHLRWPIARLRGRRSLSELSGREFSVPECERSRAGGAAECGATRARDLRGTHSSDHRLSAGELAGQKDTGAISGISVRTTPHRRASMRWRAQPMWRRISLSVRR